MLPLRRLVFENRRNDRNVWGSNRKSDTNAAAGNDRAADSVPMTVGRYLKTEREARGEDLPHVADMLRIHKSYLQAIEENEIDKLPGPTYAVGFVRAYAEHLGLDGEQVIARFKEEDKVHDRQTQLVFPSPLPEGRVPSGAVLLLALVLLSAAYGGWVYVSSPTGGIADMVPSLPDKFASMIDSEAPETVKSESAQTGSAETEAGKAEAAAAEAAKTATAESATAPVADARKAVETTPAVSATAPETTATDPAPDTSASAEAATTASGSTPPETSASTGTESAAAETSEPSQIAAATPAASVDGTASEQSTGSSAAESITAAATDRAESPASTEPAPEPSAARIQADDINAAVPQTPAETETATAAVTESTAAEGPPAPPAPDVSEGPKVYGEPGSGSRITIRAAMDSWVEIRDREGERLLTRVLRAGDRYHVPDRAGLTLVTGNAGGLEFAVDGAAVPPIGPVGDVRRNVSLTPDALKSGTAHTR